MKYIFIFAIIVLIGIFGFTALGGTKTPVNNQNNSAQITNVEVKLAGTLQKVPQSNNDYSHILVNNNEITGIASNNIDLDKYVGQKVEISGQYSGTTLYADKITQTH
ncbi:hypothetical protein M1271_02990 [Patescibacteria group bacterium]|nr:hypothetical protein [Patescibacteria group bacterium]MCL5798140.1 hypothetical protein [Patescibacteria group bacterium]